MFKLKYRADRRAVAYLLIIMLMFAFQWSQDHIIWPLYVVFLFFSVSIAVMAHNHNHLPMWENKYMNYLTDYWLTIFYGFPVFPWIPTHNYNHHRFTNKPGDLTITYRFSEANNLFTLLTYPAISAVYQQPATDAFLKDQWKKNRRRWWYCMSQWAVLITWWVVFVSLDWQKGLLLAVAPGMFSLFSVLIFNYVQHVHADEESEYNHSRNFVGWPLNLFLFNNGYHTIHHLKPGMHWSRLPEAHEKIKDKIDPSLIEYSFWGYILRVYVFGAVVPAFRTRSLRLQRLRQKSA